MKVAALGRTDEGLPSEYKLAASLDEFKVKIKKWICDTCPCRLCKKFQPNLGFINQKYDFKKM